MGHLVVRRSLLTSSCALLVALPFLQGILWPLAFVGLVLTLCALSKSDKLSTKAFLWQCTLFGYVFFGVVLAWIYGINTTKLIGDSFFSVLFLGLTYLIMVGSLAIGFLFFGVLYRFLHISTKNRTIILIPFIFALSEYFRSVFFSIFSFGSGGIIGPYWNFGSLGYAVANTPLKYVSRIVGLYGTSLLVVLVAVAVFQIIKKKHQYGLLLFVPLLIAGFGWQLYKQSSGSSLQVATASFAGDVEGEYQGELRDNVQKLGNLQLLVLPEYSYYFADSEGKATEYKIPKNIALTVDSRAKRESDEIKNEVTFYNNSSKVLQSYPKRFLIPGGEFIPYIYQIILFYSGNTSLITQFHEDHSVAKSPVAEQPYAYNGVSYGSLACSGAIAPSLYSSLTRQGAEVLTNSASISNLGVSPLYYKQAKQMSTFIATANARPFIQSARGGSSFVLSKDGTQQVSIQEHESVDIAQTTITTNGKKTPYSMFGEWTVWLSALIVVILISRQKIIKAKK